MISWSSCEWQELEVNQQVANDSTHFLRSTLKMTKADMNICWLMDILYYIYNFCLLCQAYECCDFDFNYMLSTQGVHILVLNVVWQYRGVMRNVCVGDSGVADPQDSREYIILSIW